jgi:hypothetical protein
MTSGVFFRLKEQFKKWWPSEQYYTEQNFNCLIYGLGTSVNDDQYIEDYKALTGEFQSSSGKIINLNNILNSSS